MVTFRQVLEMARQLPAEEQREISAILAGRTPEEEERRKAMVLELHGKHSGRTRTVDQFLAEKALEVEEEERRRHGIRV